MLKIFKILKQKRRQRARRRTVKCTISTDAEFGRNCSIDSRSTVGCYTSINNYSIVTKSFIGNYCSIGNFVTIGPGEHHLDRISTSSVFYDSAYEELTRKECIIGNDVWIGNYALIRRGVNVGNGAVIGAHAVVTKDVPPFAIVAGVPAKIIRMRFDEQTIARIQHSEWWNLPPSEARIAMDKLNTIRAE